MGGGFSPPPPINHPAYVNEHRYGLMAIAPLESLFMIDVKWVDA